MTPQAAISSQTSSTATAAANQATPVNATSGKELVEEDLFQMPVQPKLTIGSTDDPLEHEADAMADKVMRMKISEPISFVPKNIINRKCFECEKEEKLQKKESNVEATSEAPAIVHDVVNSASGRSLDSDARTFMESRFNYDFSNVKVHDNEIAAKSANSINALAYTSGNNIVFNSGQYNTTSDFGKRLLAHELTHVVQQNSAIPKKDEPVIQRSKSFAPVERSEESLGTLAHKTLLPMFKNENPDLFIEAKVPGGNKSGISLGKFGVADFYKADPTDGKSRTIGLNFDRDEPSFMTKDNKLDYGGGTYNHNKDSAPQGTTLSPRVRHVNQAPQRIELGDLKPGGSGEVILGGGQISNYMSGIEKTSEKLNEYLAKNPKETDGTNRWNVFVTRIPSLKIPDKLSYPGKGIARNRLAVYDVTGRVVPDSGLEGSLFVYKDQTSGIWSYEWIPDNVSAATGSGKVNEVLKRLNTDVIPSLTQGSASEIKTKQKSKNAQQKFSSVNKKTVQKKDEPFKDEDWKKKHFAPWKTDAEAFLGDKKELQKVQVAEALNDLNDRTGSKINAPAEVLERGKGLSKIRHWNRFGGIYGWLREKFDFIYVKVHAFAKKVKEKVQKLLKKASSSSFGSWIKALAKVIFKIFKLLGAWTINQVVDKLLGSLKEGIMNNLKILIDQITPDDVKSKVEEFEALKEKYQAIIEEKEDELINRFFGDKIEFFDKLEEFEKIAEIYSDLATLVEWGIRLLACASPPAIGCLWNLAISALEIAFAKLMQTCWFTKEIYAPIISKVEVVKNFPAEVAAKIADVANEYIPVPQGFEKIFAPITINKSDFSVNCDAAGDDDSSLSPERRAIFELIKEVGPEKFKTLLELSLKRGAGPWVLLTAERISQLKDLLKDVDISVLKEAINDPSKEISVPLEKFLKDIKTYSSQEKSLIKEAAEEKAKKEAAREKAKESQSKNQKDNQQTGGESDIIAIQVAEPPPGTKVVTEMMSSPGWISIPYGEVTPKLTPSKPNYFIGENIEVSMAFWIDKKWVWFTGISAQFSSKSSINGRATLDYSTSVNYYFKVSKDSNEVYGVLKGVHAIYTDAEATVLVQPKMEMNSSQDIYEQEAEFMSEKIMSQDQP